MAERPQVNTDLGSPEAIRTTARPLQSRAPAYAVQQTGAAALVESLSSIAPQLNRFLQNAEDDHRSKEESRAVDTIQGMTYEEAQEAVQSGTMRDTESPWFQAAFEKQFGMAHAARRRREIIEAYNNSFDKYSGNVDAFLADFAQEDLDKYQGSEFIMSGYREGMRGVLDKVRDDQAQFRSNFTREKTVDNFAEIARSAINTAIEEGSDPMAAVRGLYADHKQALGMTYGELDDVVFNIASEYAEAGDVDTVEKIINYQAVGEDGTKVGSFLSRPKYSQNAQRVLETAKANRGKMNRQANTSTVVELRERASVGALTDDDKVQLDTLKKDKQISQEMHESLLMKNERSAKTALASSYKEARVEEVRGGVLDAVLAGRSYAVQDMEIENPHDGSIISLSADELIEEAVNDAMNSLAQNNATPQQMAAHLSSWGVKQTYSVWENAMSNGYVALTESLTTEGKDGKTKLPEPALAGYMTWKSLANSPRLRDRHITDSTAAAIYRDAEILERMNVPLEEALLRSASIDRKGRSANANRLTRENLEEIVRTTKVWGKDPTNVGHIVNWIEDMARIQVDLGVGPRDAVKNAVKSYEESHTQINGASVNTRGVFLPPDFEEKSRIVLERFADDVGEDVDDLTLLPAFDGSDHWIISYQSNTAFPVFVEGRSNRVHISEIQKAERAAKPDVQEKVNSQIEQRAEDAKIASQVGPLIEEWEGMTRKERKARGLPTSKIGRQNFDWHGYIKEQEALSQYAVTPPISDR